MAGDVSRENGKRGGRPRLEATKLREALYRKVEARADELSEVIVSKAAEGDIPAWKEIADRVFGRPAQAVDVTSKGESINPYADLTDEQLQQLVESRARRAGRIAGGDGAPGQGEPAEVLPTPREAA